MGEYAKRIGEVGENVVVDFLNLIGWKNPQRNVDVVSSNPEEHGKKSNGYDGYFSYRSPMISNTLENVLYSSKYSKNPYPPNPVASFKSHYNDLATAIESFSKSEIQQETILLHENINAHFNRGIIFWLNNSGIEYNDLIQKLGRIELPREFEHDGIFLVDNKRIEFIYDSICYALLNFRDYDIDFIYFNSGFNNDDLTSKNGKLMPVQYINASIIPLRAFKSGETIVILSSIERFEKSELMKLIGIAKNIGCNLQGKTIICFPDYLVTEHLPVVEQVKQAFNDSTFTETLEVANFNNSILK